MPSLDDLAEQWPRLQSLLDEALALPAHERPGWLARWNGEPALRDTLARWNGEPALRDTLARLLQAHARAESEDLLATLPRLAGALALREGGNAGEAPRPGALIGPYRLQSLLGEGGMGEVWLAERADGQLKRPVALKLPRLSWDSGMVERLRRERDILASLDHPNIAPLLDAGVDQHGRPYLALAYVAGQTITEHCRTQALSLRERLQLVLQVAAAVAHAHARLVVHRDLKPANILVTQEGKVRLLDFGIAKLMEGDRTRETALTRQVGHALTVNYASPEQIRGEPLSTATDVYSLGVVAFELLTGQRPYRLKRGTGAELEEAITTVEPALASSQAESPAERKALRGDLDAILNQALRKDPAARYAGVAAFAADIERHLQREPVLARADRFGYRLGRLMLRHRLAAALSLSLAVSVVIGAAAAVWLALAAREESRRAIAELARQEAVKDYFIESTQRLATAAREGGAAALAEPHAVARMYEQQARAMAPRFATRPGAWQSVLEAAMLTLNYSSDFERAVTLGEEYLAHLKQHGADPGKVITAHISLGRSLFQLGRFEDAETVRRAGLAWAPEARDEDSEVSRMMVAGDLGSLLLQRGRRDEAEAVLLQGEERAAARLPRHAVRYWNLGFLAALHLNFNDARALQLAQQAHAGLVASGVAKDDDLADSLRTLAMAQQGMGLNADAEASLREAGRRVDGRYPIDNRNRVRTVGRVAASLARQGRHDSARQLLATEMAALPAADTVNARAARATLVAQQVHNEWLAGNIAAGLPLLTPDALTLVQLPGLRDPHLHVSAECMTLAASGRVDEALARAEAAMAVWPDRDLPTVTWLRMLELQATLLVERGRWEEARRNASALQQLLAKHGAGGTWSARVVNELLALAAAGLGQADEARRLLAQPMAGTVPHPVALAESQLRRATVWQALGDREQSRAEAKSALQALRGQHPDSPRLREARRLAGEG